MKDFKFVVGWVEFPESFVERHLDEVACAGAGVEVTIEFGYSPEVPGVYFGHPDRMYPAEPAEPAELDVNSLVFRVANECQRPHTDRFLEVAQQFASDWFEMNMPRIKEVLRTYAEREYREDEAEVLAEAAYIAHLQDTDDWI